ncbi:MAG: stage II sporulation protein M [Bacillota bacterium]
MRILRYWYAIIKEHRSFLLAACAVFFGSLAAGVVVGLVMQESATPLLEKLMQPLGTLAESLRNQPLYLRAAYVFLNNSRVMIMVLVGAYLGGLIPPLVLLFNGFIIGLFSASPIMTANIGLVGFLISLVPHGIFEIPAILLSGMMGLRIAKELWSGIFGRPTDTLGRVSKQVLGISPLLILLLLIAAILEIYVSSRIV